MGILEVDTTSQHPNEDQNPNPAAKGELSLAEFKRGTVSKELVYLMGLTQSGNPIVEVLARQGIWLWLAGDDNDILGVHAKQEQGRSHEAFLLANLEPDGFYVDMRFQNQELAWSSSIHTTDEIPDELIKVLDEIAALYKPEVEKARCVRAWSWYQRRTTHPAYITNMGSSG